MPLEILATILSEIIVILSVVALFSVMFIWHNLHSINAHMNELDYVECPNSKCKTIFGWDITHPNICPECGNELELEDIKDCPEQKEEEK